MKKKCFAVLLALAMLLAVLPAQARGEYLGRLRVINCEEWVSLRARPDKSSARLATVPLGAYVEGYYYNSEFVECYYNGQWGYILSTYLSNGNASSSASSHGGNYLGKMTVINCNEFVTLRASPSTSARAVTRVAKGEVVDAYYYNGTFAHCYYNGLEGYILSSYLGSGASPSSPSYGFVGYCGGDYMGCLRVINCDEWVSLRARPDKSSARLATVPLGAYVEGYYYNSEFVECYYNGQWGYILSTYLSGPDGGSSSSSQGSNYLGRKTVINCNEFVTLRASPSTSARAVTRVAKGEAVDAYYYNGTFARCYYNGLEGYILSRYLG